MDRIDVLVIGGGVVGLACARALAQAGLEVVIIESQPRIGQGVSSRNSEIIHGGLYDVPGSLKAQLCVRGKALLYAFCAAHGVDTRRCGKLIVATQVADTARLEAIRQRGMTNGVDDLLLLTRAQAQALEPALQCHAALHSPSSGIVDSHGFLTALLGDAEGAGAMLAVSSTVAAAERHGDGWQVRVQSIGQGATPAFTESIDVAARWVINAAGLDAQAVAAAMGGFPRAAIPPRHVAKGHYFSLAGCAPFSRLIYPVPTDGGLGVHLTLDLGGQARFGPDVLWMESAAAADAMDYSVDPARGDMFYVAVRRYWPGLPDGALAPAYSGIRPKLSGPGQPTEDFRIDGPAQHGVPGTVQLFGIESPGLTASMAIAECVAAIVADRQPTTMHGPGVH